MAQRFPRCVLGFSYFAHPPEILLGIAVCFATMGRVLCFTGFFLLAAPLSAQTGGRPRLGLEEAVRMALVHHPALSQAGAQVDAAAARLSLARSPYLPQLSATGQYQRTTDNTVPRRPLAEDPAWEGTSFNRFSLGASASQLIYDFGQTAGKWNAAEANVAAARSSAQALSNQIVTQVRRSYFQARAQEDLTLVAQNTLENQQKHLQQIVTLVKEGLRPEIDRLSAETNVANARVQWITTGNAYELACATFTQSLGLPATPGYAPGNDEWGPLPFEKEPVAALVDKALATRTEWVTFANQRKALEAQLRAAQGGMGPSLSAQANVSAGGAEISRLVPNGWLGLLFYWPLFQGGATSAQVREAKANLKILDAQEAAFRLSVRVEVEQVALSLLAAKSVREAAEVAMVNARKQLQLAESRYTAGLGNVIELDDAQVRASQAAAQEVNARYALASARAALRGALGIP